MAAIDVERLEGLSASLVTQDFDFGWSHGVGVSFLNKRGNIQRFAIKAPKLLASEVELKARLARSIRRKLKRWDRG